MLPPQKSKKPTHFAKIVICEYLYFHTHFIFWDDERDERDADAKIIYEAAKRWWPLDSK